MSDAPRLPGNNDRTVVVGRTGTGKTVAGAWLLSLKDFNGNIPWYVFNTKGDELLNEIQRITGQKNARFDDAIAKSGIHFLRPLPHEMQSDMCERFLWNVHKRGRVGLFFDEGYMLDKFSKALQAIYTQGRSLRIPTITLSQKPKYLTPFTWSEADYFMVFHLNDANDRKRVEEFMPADLDRRLPPRHSLWYDVGRHTVTEFRPVPAPDRILETFDAKLRVKHRAV